MADPRDSWNGENGVMIYGRSTEKNKKHQIQPHDQWIVCSGKHAPFISAEKWLAVQERFRQNTFNKKQKYDIPLLKGTLRCAKCGGLMQVSRKKLVHGVTSHYYCLKRMRQGVNACDMRMIKCNILDDQVLDIFRQIEADPGIILKYTGIEEAQDDGTVLKEMERRANNLRTKIERLAETLSDSESSTAAKYIVAQIEKEDLELEALNREIEIKKAEARRNKNAAKTMEDRTAEITRLISGLDGFSAAERNEIVREVVRECTWNGETLFLRL